MCFMDEEGFLKGFSRLKKFLPYVLIILPCLLLYRNSFENDTYWLLNTGKYILSHGFPNTEPFTMHQGLDFTAQQWLTTVVFYLFYSYLGTLSLYILNIIIFIFIGMVIYKTSLKLCKNVFIAIPITVASCIILSFYMVLRPQIFSIAIFALQVYFLECYAARQRKIYLVLIPVLSVLLINFHAALWPFFFVLYIPYIVDGLKFSRFGIKTQGYGIGPMIFTLVVSLAAGVINPYGYRNMTYLLQSYGNKTIGSSISEMMSPDFKSADGIIIFLLLVLFVLIHIKVKGSSRPRYFLITLGTLYMGLSSLRSMPLFIVTAMPFMAYYMRDIRIPETTQVNKKLRIICSALLVVTITGLFFLRPYDYTESMEYFRPVKAAEYIKDNLDLKNIRLYNNFNVGGYLEFCGIKTFIDSRAEIFLKSVNKKNDIIIDFFNVSKGFKYYKDFINRYSFNCFLFEKVESLQIYVDKDPDYKKVYEDKKFAVYVKK